MKQTKKDDSQILDIKNSQKIKMMDDVVSDFVENIQKFSDNLVNEIDVYCDKDGNLRNQIYNIFEQAFSKNVNDLLYKEELTSFFNPKDSEETMYNISFFESCLYYDVKLSKREKDHIFTVVKERPNFLRDRFNEQYQKMSKVKESKLDTIPARVYHILISELLIYVTYSKITEYENKHQNIPNAKPVQATMDLLSLGISNDPLKATENYFKSKSEHDKFYQYINLSRQNEISFLLTDKQRDVSYRISYLGLNDVWLNNNKQAVLKIYRLFLNKLNGNIVKIDNPNTKQREVRITVDELQEIGLYSNEQHALEGLIESDDTRVNKDFGSISRVITFLSHLNFIKIEGSEEQNDYVVSSSFLIPTTYYTSKDKTFHFVLNDYKNAQTGMPFIEWNLFKQQWKQVSNKSLTYDNDSFKIDNYITGKAREDFKKILLNDGYLKIDVLTILNEALMLVLPTNKRNYNKVKNRLAGAVSYINANSHDYQITVIKDPTQTSSVLAYLYGSFEIRFTEYYKQDLYKISGADKIKKGLTDGLKVDAHGKLDVEDTTRKFDDFLAKDEQAEKQQKIQQEKERKQRYKDSLVQKKIDSLF